MLRRFRSGRDQYTPRPPDPHPSGERPPAIPPALVPNHVALVMDGNGRWAKSRGLPRTEGHRRGEEVLSDVVSGAIELGVKWLSVYVFSTENWKRSPEEVRFLMGYNRDVLAKRTEFMVEHGVRVRWAGRRPKLWRSVIDQLEDAEERTKDNDLLTLTLCVNYGGRAEIADATKEIAQRVAAGEINPDKIDEKTIAKYLYHPDMPDVDLFLRPSGELRTSNFLVWQSAYAELVFMDTLFPDFDRLALWRACEAYAQRDRRFGGVKNQQAGPTPPADSDDYEVPVTTDPAGRPLNESPQAGGVIAADPRAEAGLETQNGGTS